MARGMSLVIDNPESVEMMQMGGQATHLIVSPDTEITMRRNWADLRRYEIDDEARPVWGAFEPWESAVSTVNHATVYGVGQDNPVNPYDLLDLRTAARMSSPSPRDGHARGVSFVRPLEV